MSEADEFISFLARKIRERAAEARTVAGTLRDPEARRTMLEVAESYEKLAWRLDNEG
jgi:hypothetical protein